MPFVVVKMSKYLVVQLNIKKMKKGGLDLNILEGF